MPKGGKISTGPKAVSWMVPIEIFHAKHILKLIFELNHFFFFLLDGESPSDIPKGYPVENIDTGIGFDEWVAIEKKKDYNRRTPLRINSM